LGPTAVPLSTLLNLNFNHFFLKLYSGGSPHCGKVYIYKKRKYIFIRKENKLYKSPLTTQSCGIREDENLREGSIGRKEALSLS